MTVQNPVVVGRRFTSEALRTVRRLTRQIERRLRYRRLGWV